MTKRIFFAILYGAVLGLVACLAILVGALYPYFTTIQRDQLSAHIALAAQGVEHEGAAYFQNLDADGIRLTWVAADGTVLADNEANPSDMENHSSRKEIVEALSYGNGNSERTSATLSQKTLYRARRLPDGTVLRVSVTQDTVFRLLLGMAWPIFLSLMLAALLSALLARELSNRIVNPLNALDLDHPLENNAYPELSPLLRRVESQHRQISLQLEELRQKQDEFSAVTSNMNEGLILLNDQCIILSINPAAANLFATDIDCAGKHILTVDRSLPMQELVMDAQRGQRAERILKRNGRIFQADASPAFSSGKLIGLCLLFFDTTEKTQAEQQRREFSANVSHELKTPLHTILGSAELIGNGLAKPADLPRFASHIRAEASRLVTLIDDIIRLSQLDEGAEMPSEIVDLKILAEEAAKALTEKAAAKNVSLSVRGDAAPISGVRRMLYEIVYNLCDNAIQYNKEGGRVDITLKAESQDRIALSVADTGIGIPPEHHARIFERFYRVDKSHSRDTGGTGLGLAIVRHAVELHNGVISLESEVGKGTTIIVRFPR